MPCASSSPGATASMNRRMLLPDRRTTHAPARTPTGIAPPSPSPPAQPGREPAGDGLRGRGQVDLQPSGEPRSLSGVESGAQQLLCPPALDALQLRLDDLVYRRHLLDPSAGSFKLYFGIAPVPVHP